LLRGGERTRRARCTYSPQRRRGLARQRGGQATDIDEHAAAPLRAAPQAQPEEEDDPELRAALAAFIEVNDLEELAKWPHLAEVLGASALEEEARKAKEDVDAWALLAMARR
jgi:hypothetical protein